MICVQLCLIVLKFCENFCCCCFSVYFHHIELHSLTGPIALLWFANHLAFVTKQNSVLIALYFEHNSASHDLNFKLSQQLQCYETTINCVSVFNFCFP